MLRLFAHHLSGKSSRMLFRPAPPAVGFRPIQQLAAMPRIAAPRLPPPFRSARPLLAPPLRPILPPPARPMGVTTRFIEIDNTWVGLVKILGIMFSTFAAHWAYLYVKHLEKVPTSKRSRLMVFTPKQVEEISQYEYKQLMIAHGDFILPESHADHKRILGVVQKILKANAEDHEVYCKDWTVTVVDGDMHQEVHVMPRGDNVQVTPTGDIFIFRGLLPTCENDDDLGVVLAHAIAHCALGHIEENLGEMYFFDLMYFIRLEAFISGIPASSDSTFFSHKMRHIVHFRMEFPFTDMMEYEADEYGLYLAAKAGVDISKARDYWEKASNAFLMHPTNEPRYRKLEELVKDNQDQKKG